MPINALNKKKIGILIRLHMRKVVSHKGESLFTHKWTGNVIVQIYGCMFSLFSLVLTFLHVNSFLIRFYCLIVWSSCLF